MHSLISLLGMLVLIGIAFSLSTDRSAINRRTVTIAFVLQAALAALILYVPFGRDLLTWVANGVQYVINYGNDGVDFVFGGKAKESLGFTIALNVLPIIVFFSALMSVLYYLGVMQWIVSTFGGWLHKLLRTSQTESMSAVSNIFVGHTEAPLVVKP